MFMWEQGMVVSCKWLLLGYSVATQPPFGMLLINSDHFLTHFYAVCYIIGKNGGEIPRKTWNGAA